MEAHGKCYYMTVYSIYPTKLFLTHIVCEYQLYNPSQNVSGFNDVLLPICIGFKFTLGHSCINMMVMQFIVLFQISHEINKVEPVESIFAL